MNTVRKSGALAAAVTGVTMLLSSCAEPPATGAGSPGPESSPNATQPGEQQVLSDDEAKALASLESYQLNSAYVALARAEVIEKCMADRGFTGYPQSAFHNPLLDVVLEQQTPEAAALWAAQGKVPNIAMIVPSPELAQYGYSGASYESPTQTSADAEYYAMSPDEQNAVSIALYGTDRDNNQVVPPEESCDGAAAAQMGGPISYFEGLDETQVSTILGLIEGSVDGGTLAQLEQNAAVKAATSAWLECVTANGYPSATAPGVPGGNSSGSDPAKGLSAESAFAAVGAECDQDAGLNASYSTAVQMWQLEQLKPVVAQFNQFIDSREAQFSAAREYLGLE